MYVDSHVHLQPHGEKPPMTRERLELYVAAARASGIECIAITEHLFRFREAYELLRGWWDEQDDEPALIEATAAYFRDNVSASVADYVRMIEDAKSDGLPVLLGIEMDWIASRAEDIRRFLAPYDWDIVLGSIHWLGAWGFDSLDNPVWAPEWRTRDLDAEFARYGVELRALASSGLCDVLAHPDLPKIAGHRPATFTPLHDAIVEAAANGGCAVEINGNGYNKPVAEAYPAPAVLKRANQAGLRVTLASDAHTPEAVGQRFDALAALALDAGYHSFAWYEARRPRERALALPSEVLET